MTVIIVAANTALAIRKSIQLALLNFRNLCTSWSTDQATTPLISVYGIHFGLGSDEGPE